MNKLQYAIAEGMVKVYFWFVNYRDDSSSVQGRLYAVPGTNISMDHLNYEFTIDGEKHKMDGDFYSFYGELVDDHLAAASLGAAWLHDSMVTQNTFTRDTVVPMMNSAADDEL